MEKKKNYILISSLNRLSYNNYMINEAITKKYQMSSSKYGSLYTIKNLCGTNKTILDVGCSSGYLGEIMKGNRFYGIDGNIEAAKIAKTKYIDVKIIDLNTIPDKPVFNEKFDIIIFADVLEHLLYPEQILSHFKSYLKPHGKIIVSLPNIALWRVRFNLLFGKFDYGDYGVLDRTHLHLYTFKSARELLERSGYKVVFECGAANALGFIVRYFKFLRKIFSINIIMVGIINEIY